MSVAACLASGRLIVSVHFITRQASQRLCMARYPTGTATEIRLQGDSNPDLTSTITMLHCVLHVKHPSNTYFAKLHPKIPCLVCSLDSWAPHLIHDYTIQTRDKQYIQRDNPGQSCSQYHRAQITCSEDCYNNTSGLNTHLFLQCALYSA